MVRLTGIKTVTNTSANAKKRDTFKDIKGPLQDILNVKLRVLIKY